MDFILETDHKKRIIFRKFFGEPDMDCINQSWMQLLEMKEFRDEHYSLLTDYSQSKVDVRSIKMKDVVEFYKKYRLFRKNKHAVVTMQPTTTALSAIVENKGYCYKTFSNKDAALNWLEI